MNRKQFQLWLDQFPEDTEIYVGIQQSPPEYCPHGIVEMTKFAKETDWYYNKRILELGAKL